MPEGETHVALALTLEPGWHVYWVCAGDSGEAPEVQRSAPPGISMGPMQYAAPSRLPLGPLMDYGYEGTAVFPFDRSASPQTSLGIAERLYRFILHRRPCDDGGNTLNSPLMGAAIGFALSQSALVTSTVFTSLALGLALPYLV